MHAAPCCRCLAACLQASSVPVPTMRLRRPLLLWAPALLLLAWMPLPSKAQDSADLLLAFKDSLANGDESLPDWTGADPCKGPWSGLTCTSQGQVTEL